MNYAVLQKTLEAPAIDKLRRAFRNVPGLTPADAHILGNDAFGILVKGFTLERASAMQRALAAEGVESEVVPEPQLPKLPEVRFVNRVDCTSHALMVFDPLGRSFPVEWKHIALIAAGRVCMTEFNRMRVVREVVRYSQDGSPYRDSEVNYDTREERNDRLLLELVLSRGVLRYSVTADKAAARLFQYLGARGTGDLLKDFTLLVQDVAKFAPHAVINRGAYYFRKGAAEPFRYPTKNAFYEEIVWLRWKLANAQEAVA